MDLLSWFKSRLWQVQPPIRSIAAGLLILALIAGLTPVADTLWAEVLTVSGEIETGEFEESPTPTENRAVWLLFEWLSPILPDLNWLLTAFIGTLVPLFGFFYLQNSLP
ncbi:hypothetical protein AC812_03655, partial [Bellilinea caldifistulae]